MSIEIAFSIFSTLALLGWVALIGFPRWLHGRKYLTGNIPGIFAATYAYLFLALYFTALGGYGSLEDVVLRHYSSASRIRGFDWNAKL